MEFGYNPVQFILVVSQFYNLKFNNRQSQLSKMERRQLFAIKVAQEEEERLRRQHQENLWQEQVQLAAQELAQAQELAAQEANNFTGFQGFPPPQQWPPHFPPGLFDIITRLLQDMHIWTVKKCKTCPN